MLLNNTNMNIPDLSVGEVMRNLSELYCGAINARYPLKDIPAAYLQGAFGLGKSESVKQMAKIIEEMTGKKTFVTDVRLLLFSPVDLRGVPFASDDGFADWLKPRIFDMDDSDDVINILFLDELSAAPPSTQAAAYQITLDRVIGEHKLPDNCIVIAAGNRTTDKSVAYAMPKALCNRLLHFNIHSDVSSWLTWAINNNIDERIIGFISFDNSRLFDEVGLSDFAFATPRSWTFVSKILTVTKPKKITDAFQLISSAVGKDNALAFTEYCEIYPSLPDIASIRRGTCRDYPRNQQILYALISSLVVAIRETDDISLTELENICNYVSHFSPDFAYTFYSDVNRINGLDAKLAKTKSLQQWLSKHNKRL